MCNKSCIKCTIQYVYCREAHIGIGNQMCFLSVGQVDSFASSIRSLSPRLYLISSFSANENSLYCSHAFSVQAIILGYE